MRILLLLFTIVLCSCESNTNRTVDLGNGTNSPSTGDTNQMAPSDLVLEQTGTFSNRNGYSVSGTAELHYSASTNTYSLFLKNFVSQNGPALKVYISQDETENVFVDLGNLNSLTGEQRYDFPASSYNTSLDNVLIWCDAIDQSFGVATF